jgi:hypothetical protein
MMSRARRPLKGRLKPCSRLPDPEIVESTTRDCRSFTRQVAVPSIRDEATMPVAMRSAPALRALGIRRKLAELPLLAGGIRGGAAIT